jgi:hypothetical protein
MIGPRKISPQKGLAETKKTNEERLRNNTEVVYTYEVKALKSLNWPTRMKQMVNRHIPIYETNKSDCEQGHKNRFSQTNKYMMMWTRFCIIVTLEG